jgi:dTDP-4-amino-4,6-dideoxy-D-galactose acyltransferase
MSTPCQFLSWDTDFFGFRIARVNPYELTPELMPVIDAWAQTEAIRCLYLLANIHDPSTTYLAEDHGFHFVDLRLTLEQKLDRGFKPPVISPLIHHFQPDDLPHLEAIARNSYTDSRFYYDPGFPRERCDEFYATWIRNSSNGSGFADVVLVAKADGLSMGYISGKCHGTIGHIGLVGVAEQARGRSLGQALVNSLLNWFVAQGMTSVQVVTQGRNIAAQRLYQRCGFLTASLESWYHKWY